MKSKPRESRISARRGTTSISDKICTFSRYRHGEGCRFGVCGCVRVCVIPIAVCYIRCRGNKPRRAITRHASSREEIVRTSLVYIYGLYSRTDCSRDQHHKWVQNIVRLLEHNLTQRKTRKLRIYSGIMVIKNSMRTSAQKMTTSCLRISTEFRASVRGRSFGGCAMELGECVHTSWQQQQSAET